MWEQPEKEQLPRTKKPGRDMQSGVPDVTHPGRASGILERVLESDRPNM